MACPNLLYNETLQRRSQAGIWIHSQLVRNHFTSELVEVECQSWMNRKYPTKSECLSIADAAIRSVKVATAFPIASDLIGRITDNELVKVSADWHDTIEGNTFHYYRKVAFLQTLADDARVERITEIGFNAGHSVSPHIPKFLVPSVFHFR